MHGPNNPRGQLNLAVRDDSLESPAGGFLALVRKAANAFAIRKTQGARTHKSSLIGAMPR
jgi:hypothetical protein